MHVKNIKENAFNLIVENMSTMPHVQDRVSLAKRDLVNMAEANLLTPHDFEKFKENRQLPDVLCILLAVYKDYKLKLTVEECIQFYKIALKEAKAFGNSKNPYGEETILSLFSTFNTSMLTLLQKKENDSPKALCSSNW